MVLFTPKLDEIQARNLLSRLVSSDQPVSLGYFNFALIEQKNPGNDHCDLEDLFWISSARNDERVLEIVQKFRLMISSQLALLDIDELSKETYSNLHELTKNGSFAVVKFNFYYSKTHSLMFARNYLNQSSAYSLLKSKIRFAEFPGVIQSFEIEHCRQLYSFTRDQILNHSIELNLNSVTILLILESYLVLFLLSVPNC